MPENYRKCAGNSAKWLARPENGLPITPLSTSSRFIVIFCLNTRLEDMCHTIAFGWWAQIQIDTVFQFALSFGLFRLSTHLRSRVNAFTLGFKRFYDLMK